MSPSNNLDAFFHLRKTHAIQRMLSSSTSRDPQSAGAVTGGADAKEHDPREERAKKPGQSPTLKTNGSRFQAETKGEKSDISTSLSAFEYGAVRYFGLYTRGIR